MTGTDVRSDTPRSTARTGAQWLLGVFIALALVATVIMVVSKDMSIFATLAVAAALWAAVIGAVLMTKYRRQADVAESRSRDLRLVYELQLEREIAARRQYESEVEASIRQEVREEETEELDELKAQVLALRASLEKLLGNPLPEVPLALYPERRRELGAGPSRTGYTASEDDRVAADLDFASTAPPSAPGRHAPAGSSGPSRPDDVSDVEMTDLIAVIADDEPVADHEDFVADEAFVEETVADEPFADGTSPSDSAQYEQAQYEQAQYEQAQYEQVQPEPVHDDADVTDTTSFAAISYTPPPIPPTPQRRRQGPQGGEGADDDPGAHSAGRPVSELLSQLRTAGTENPGSGRRRRD